MLQRKKKQYVLGLITGLLLGTSLFANPIAYATEVNDSEETVTELATVDKTAGVTYVYGDTDTEQTNPIGLNLNGNSVVIQVSANSTDETPLNNIYIDYNMNGKVDGDEEMVALDGTTDIKTNLAIYGVYRQKTTHPISITVNSGLVPAIFGVYEGESMVSEQTAIAIMVNGGTISSTLFGAYDTTVTADSGSAVALTINDGTVSASAVAAAMNADVQATGATALQVKVNGGTVPSTVFGASSSEIVSDGAGAIEMIMDSQSETRTSTAIGANDCTIEVKNSDAVGVYTEVKSGNIGTTMAVYGSTYKLTDCSAPAVHGVIASGTLSTVQFVHGSTVESDGTNTTLIDIDVSGGNISRLNGVVYSNVDSGKKTNVVVDMDVTGSTVINGTFIAVGGSESYSNTLKEYTVVGNVDVNFDFKELPASGSNINSAYIVTYGAVVDGDVNIALNNARVGSSYGLYYAYVKGNYTYNHKSTCDLTGSTFAGNYAKIDGDAEVTLQGGMSSSCGSIYGFSGAYKNSTSIVGGDFKVNYIGGTTSSFYGIYGSSNSSKVYPSVGGNVTINITGGKISSLYGVEYVNVEKAVNFIMKDCALISYGYGVYHTNAGGDVTVDVTNNTNASTDYSYLYATQNLSAEGNVEVTVDGGYYRGIYGVYGYNNGSVIKGNVDVTIQNVNIDSTNYSSGSYSYGVYGTEVAGNVTVSATNSKLYTLYGTHETKCENDITVDIDNVVTNYYIYGAGVYSAGGNISSTITDSEASYVYGVYQYGGNCGGNVTSTITDTTASQYIYGIQGNRSYSIAGDATVMIKGCDCTAGYTYGMSNTTILGDTDITIEDGTLGSSNGYGYIYGVDYCNTQGESTVTLKDLDITGSLYPYQATSGSGNGDATVYITGVNLSTGTNSTGSLANASGEGQTVTTIIDDTSVIPDNVYIYPSSSYTGDGTLTYKDNLYLGGRMVFSEDATYDTVHFCSGYYLIPEEVTVTVNDGIYIENGYLLLEGTLDGPLAGTLNENSLYSNSYVYMNGGTMTQDLDKVAYVYYPLDVEFLSQGGTVTKTTGTALAGHVLRPGQSFVQVGKTVSYVVNANEGYSLTSATVKTEKADAPVDAAVSGNVYSFVMEDSPTTFNVVFTGNQIVLGKTVADPVINLNQEYTDEMPVYDLSSVSISNDALAGEVTFKLDALAGLPEGLIIKDNKIFGVPTVAYEEGKKTIIHVTGKNGTQADLILNIVVTENDGTQTSQEGRITIDETNAIVYLNGNSIVMETQENNTAIYLDDNRDGVADSETPVFVGDLTNYAMYGIRNTDAKNKIRITMNGGTIGTIYGAHNGNLVDEVGTLEIYVNGGSVGAMYGLSDSITTGTMKVIIADAATAPFTTITGNAGYGGLYYNNKGAAYFYGTYELDEALEVTNAYIYDDLTIEDNGSLNITNRIYRYSGSRIFLRGDLAATNIYYQYGAILMQGGTLPEGSTWSNVYYPVETSTNLQNTSITFGSNVIALTEDGVKQYYLNAATSVSLSMTAAPGYDYYYSVDGGEYVAVSAGSGTFTMPRKAITFSGEYVPKQISVTKQFAEPEAIVNTEYTEASPLYDFASLKIADDTTASYGGEVKYALKSGSVLPKGLTFTGTKLIGTPTVVNETGDKVTFVVTGRNGSTADVELTIAVQPVDYEKVDINDTVTMNSSTINLNGTSVVIVGDPTSDSKASIYPDLNRDKIADNNIPLLVGGATSYSLSSYVIYGYANTETAYEGDISITMKGGYTKGIYGAYSSTDTEKVVVNGDVSVYIEGGFVSNYASKVYALYNGTADNVTLEVTGGRHAYSEFVGAYNSTVKENVNYTFGGTVDVSASSSTSYRVYAHAAEKSTVGGDVNLTIGGNTDCFNSGYSYSYFYGVYGSTITGNVNCKQVGAWYPGASYIVYNSTVGKNLDIDWNAGYIPYTYCALDSTITGDVTVDAAEEATLSGSYMYLLYNSKAANMYAKVPQSVTGAVTIHPYYNGTTCETNVVYIDNKGDIKIDGTYTIDENMDVKSLYIYENGNVTIEENTEVTATSTTTSYVYGKLENKGTMNMNAYLQVNGTLVNNGNLAMNNTSYVYGSLDNYGDLKTTMLYIYENANVINHEAAIWEIASRIVNSYGGKIVNYGEFNQTCTTSTSYYYRLGLVYTTKALNLYGDISRYVSSTSYSTIYYPITVEYPSQCVESVTISGDYVGSSGIEGDTNQYVRGGSTFTVTLGEQLMDTVTLQNVTYGPESTIATEQEGGQWQGTAVYEPFTVSVNYGAGDAVTKITLDKESDKIENTESATPLVVDTYYPYSSPLYDLTTIKISNDIEGEGIVAYSLDVSSTLPEGMYLRDGKLYGTLKKANEEEQVIKFVIKGKNQTSAFFTLTLGAVAKKIPAWNVPTGLTAVVGETLSDIYIPYVSGGTYSWPDATVSVGTEVTTLENVELRFTPTDVENYDWETAAANAGATYTDGVITCTVSVAVSAGKPSYTIPENITATYGQTFGEVPIDSGDNDGTFTWNYASDKSVGSAGTHYYYVTYTPNDTENYQTVSGIVVALTVNKAKPTYTNTLTSVSQDCGITLADIVLPDATDGKYQWITTSTTIPINGTQYQAGYKPNDTRNYDWSSIEGWNSAWGCVVFPVTVYVNHTYSEEWTYDDDYHWHTCLDEACESQGDKAEHEWIEGEVIEESTLTSTGSREYNCACGAEKVEVTPVLPHTEHTYPDTWNYNDNCHWKECTFEGCTKTTMPVVHTLNDGVVDVEATDRNPGVLKYSCECGYYETEEIPQLPHTVHTYGDTWEHNETTHWQKCTYEGCDYESTPVAHTWDTKTVMTPATETTTGVMKYTCVCGEEKIETIPVLEHTHAWGEGKVTKPATPTTAGEETFTCTGCGETKTEVIPATGETSNNPTEGGTSNVPAAGTVLQDDDPNAEYTVITSTGDEPEVSYKVTNKNAKTIEIPDVLTVNGVTYKVTVIADNAFKNHKTLKKVVIGDNVTAIGKNAFYGCKKLTSVTIGKNVMIIGDGAFQNCTALKKITIPSKVTTIGKKAFYGCKKLATVKMGANVETIGNSAFQNCTVLKKLDIPSKVKKIGSKAFYNCKKLTSIKIKTTKLTTKNVGKKAFTKAGSKNYKKLTVKVPKSKLKAYKTMLKKRGLSSKAKVKK